MDYLEGALLGKLWSDTDFENRRHRGVALLLCGLFWLYGFYLIFLVNFTNESTAISIFPIWFLLSAVMLIISPFLCYFYYNMPLPVRWLFLLLQGLKYLFVVFFLYSLLLPFLRIDKDHLISSVLAFFNENISTVFERSMETQSMGSLFFNAILLAVAAMLALSVLFALLALIPAIYIKLIGLLQFTIDQAFIRFMRSVKGGAGQAKALRNKGAAGGRRAP